MNRALRAVVVASLCSLAHGKVRGRGMNQQPIIAARTSRVSVAVRRLVTTTLTAQLTWHAFGWVAQILSGLITLDGETPEHYISKVTLLLAMGAACVACVAGRVCPSQDWSRAFGARRRRRTLLLPGGGLHDRTNHPPPLTPHPLARCHRSRSHTAPHRTAPRRAAEPHGGGCIVVVVPRPARSSR